MNKKTLLIALVFPIIILFILFLPSSKEKEVTVGSSSASNAMQATLFYGQGCPHCTAVTDYIKEKRIEEKITISEKEIYYNNENAQEFEKRAQSCGLARESMGVPMLWANNECILGSPNIIDFLNDLL